MKVALIVLLIVAVVSVPLAGEDPSNAAPEQPGYVIGLDDVLRVVVWGEEGLDLTLRVRPDGYVSLPLARDVQAVGLTPGDLSIRLAMALSDYLREPDVTVMVEQINSFKIYVLGRVSNQGVLSFTEAPGLLQVLAAAGGLTEFSSEDVTIIRKQDQKETRFDVDLKHIFSGKSGARNIYLEPGDVVLVH